jgi:hypothetical protein
MRFVYRDRSEQEKTLPEKKGRTTTNENDSFHNHRNARYGSCFIRSADTGSRREARSPCHHELDRNEFGDQHFHFHQEHEEAREIHCQGEGDQESSRR